MGTHDHSHSQSRGHRFSGSVDNLRAPHRLALLEVGRVVDLCLEGIEVATVLDVGTGSGVFAEEFARRGLLPTGIDVNPDMLVVARQHVPSAQFTEAPADALPFDDGAFDLVFLGHILHEVDDPVLALKEAHRVARGRVAVLEWPYRAEEHGPPLEHRLRDEDITAFAREAGLRHVERIALTHMALYRLSA